MDEAKLMIPAPCVTSYWGWVLRDVDSKYLKVVCRFVVSDSASLRLYELYRGLLY